MAVITTLSSRQFNQDTGRAKQAAKKGPVVITDRGKPAHVLLNFEEYERLKRKGLTVLDALSMPGDDDIEFKPEKSILNLKVPDFS